MTLRAITLSLAFALITFPLITWAAVPAHAADKAAAAEVTKFYADLDHVMNSPDLVKNPAMMFPFFDKDVMMYDIMLPETFVGESFRKHLENVIVAFPGKTKLLDMNIRADKDLAVATYIQDFTGQMGDAAVKMRIRTTDALEKKNGKWVIYHEHVSLPLDETTMAAVMTKKK
jgi:ketosteroid isomerase-like protein